MSTQQFITTCTFPPFFVNKHDGQPLAFGSVKFYSNKDKTRPKDIYIFVDGQYKTIGADVPLNGGGYLTNSSSEPLIPYFNLYDVNKNREGYYYEVFDSFGNLHFVEDDLFADKGDYSQNDIINKDFVVNGNFLRHLKLPKTPALEEGRVRENITHFAFGGWAYETDADYRQEHDFINFDIQNPPTQTRFLLRRKCTQSSASATYKRVRKISYGVTDINSPSQSPLEGYTLCLIVQAPSPVTIKVNIVRNYGDKETKLNIGDINISQERTVINKNFNVPYEDLRVSDDVNDRDFWALEFEEPLQTTFDYLIGEVHIFSGFFNVVFPVSQISDINAAASMVGPMKVPAYDRMDIGLPVYQTENGYQVNRFITGTKILSQNDPGPYYLPFDDKAYNTYDLSPEGVPYKRLWEVLCKQTPIPGLSKWGSGENYVTANYCHGIANAIFLVANNTFDTFSFNSNLSYLTFTQSIKQSVDSRRTAKTICPNQLYQTNGIIVVCREQGLIRLEDVFLPAEHFVNIKVLDQLAYSYSRILFNIRDPLPDQLEFTIPNTIQNVHFRVRVDTASTTPPNFNEVFLTNGCDEVDSLYAVKAAVGNKQHAYLTFTKAATDIKASDFFEIGVTNPSKTITFYFIKDGVGIPPPSAAITVPIYVKETSTVKEILTAIIYAINSYQFTLPSEMTERVIKAAYYFNKYGGPQNNTNDPFFESDLDIDWNQYFQTSNLSNVALMQADYVKTVTTGVITQDVNLLVADQNSDAKQFSKYVELQGEIVENKQHDYDLSKYHIPAEGSALTEDVQLLAEYLYWGENTVKSVSAFLYIHI